MTKLIGIAVLLISAASFAFAGAVQTPEIDATSTVAALGLVSGGVLVLRARGKR